MTIRQRIALGYLVTIALLVVTAAGLLIQFEGHLVDNAGSQQRQRAAALIAELDHTTYYRSEMLREFANTNAQIRYALQDSIREMQAIGSDHAIRAYVTEEDRKWRAATAGAPTPVMESINSSPVSDLLRDKQRFYRSKYGYSLFPEIFITNRYGVNIGHTNPTSDFEQSDEHWWTRGRDLPQWIGEFTYDQSAGSYSQEIVVRIADVDGSFLGVMKAVMNVAEYRRIIERFTATSEFSTLRVQLLDPAGKVLYRATPEHTDLVTKDVRDLAGYGEDRGGFSVMAATEGDLLRAFARSSGYGDFPGLNWTVTVDVDADEIFAPLSALWGGVVVAGLSAIGLAALWAMLVTRTIVRPLHGAVRAAEELARGQVEVTLPSSTKDELSRLVESMGKLQAYTAAVARAAEAIAVGDVSVETERASEQDVLNRAFTRMVEYHRSVAEVARRIAVGEIDVTVASASDRDVLSQSFADTVAYIKRIATIADRIAEGDVGVEVKPLSDRDVLNRAFARTISYLADMSRVADRIAEGDLTESPRPRSDSDAMGRSLRRMVGNLILIVQDLAIASDNVFSTSEHLSATSGRIANGARLQANAAQEARLMMGQAVEALATVVDRAKVLHGQATATRSSMEELDAATRSIAQGVDNLTRTSQEARRAITEVQSEIELIGTTAREVEYNSAQVVVAAQSGRSAVKNTTQSIKGLSQTLRDVVDVSHALRESTREIGQVLEFVDEVVEQSNLLALNASIAAAQAGSHGDAFAVVATEIRRLAQGTRRSSEEIRALVKRLQDVGQRVVKVTESGRLRAEEGLGLAQRATDALQHIEEGVGSTHEQLAEVQRSLHRQAQRTEAATSMVHSMTTTIGAIHNATAGQTRESRQIVQALHDMDDMAQRATDSVADQRSRADRVLVATEEIEHISHQSLQMAQDIVKAIHGLRNQAEHLRAAAGRFQLPAEPDSSKR